MWISLAFKATNTGKQSTLEWSHSHLWHQTSDVKGMQHIAHNIQRKTTTLSNQNRDDITGILLFHSNFSESIVLKMKTYKAFKMLIIVKYWYFYFSKMQQKCFMLDTIQPSAESVNPYMKKNIQSIKHLLNVIFISLCKRSLLTIHNFFFQLSFFMYSVDR